MIHKNCASKIPEPRKLLDGDLELLQKAYDLLPELRDLIDQLRFSIYLKKVIAVAALANEYINQQAPWKLKTDNPQRMQDVLYSLSEVIRVIAIYLNPFIPESVAKILFQLGIDNEVENGFVSLNKKITCGKIT